jgi:hypothetical protein
LVFVPKDGLVEAATKRTNYPLFDRMVAFNMQRDVTIPLSPAKFYAGRKLEVLRLEAVRAFLKKGLGRARLRGYL